MTGSDRAGKTKLRLQLKKGFALLSPRPRMYSKSRVSTRMKAKSKTPKATKQPAPSLLSSLVLVLALSLATWLFFYQESLKLDGPATTVVVGVWFLVVFLAKKIWLRFRKKSA